MQSIPDTEAAIASAMFLCVLAFLVIVSCHLIGLHWAVRFFRLKQVSGGLRDRGFQHTAGYIVLVMFLLFLLHMFTNFAWGMFIFLVGVLPHYRDGVYYSLENYTSLGLTRVTVSDTWRMLAPMISLSGVFCLGWSTAMLVNLFGRLYAVDADQ